MIFTDTHTHLFLPEFDHDREEIVDRAIAQGVKYMLVPNIDMGSIGHVLELCEKYPDNCFPMIGLHPESVNGDFLNQIKQLEKILLEKRFYGIGETGLDYYWDTTFKEQQKESFEYQIELAIKYNLPLVIHVRKSSEDVLEILRRKIQPGLTGVFHCFSGTVNYAREIIELGFFLGIGGVVTFKNGRLEEVISEIPLDKIVLETDAPYLAPVPFRGKRNESTYIPYIAGRIASIKNISVSEVAAITTQNALKVFQIPSSSEF
jgi:TatD DNase family protein